MITVLEYLVIAAVIGLVIFLIAVFVFGRGEQMSALSPRTSPSELPEGAIGGDEVRRVRFGLALRGYRMSDVDWTLERLSDELDRLHRRVADLGGEPLPPGVGADPAAHELFPHDPDFPGDPDPKPDGRLDSGADGGPADLYARTPATGAADKAVTGASTASIPPSGTGAGSPPSFAPGPPDEPDPACPS